jgi:hypothetical protein
MSDLAAQLVDWTPVHLSWSPHGPVATWAQLVGARFTRPFFEDEVEGLMQYPYHLLMQRRTPLEVMGEVAIARPGLAPAGFIFHMSRCGSTVISQMLAAVPEHLVFSEPATLDFVLHAHLYAPGLPTAQQVQWLQWLVGALGQVRDPAQHHLFIKFSYWHVFALPLIRRTFPNVPWIFVYRDPVEVLVSNLDKVSPQFLPSPLGAALLGLDLQSVAAMSFEEYVARAVGATCAAVVHEMAAARENGAATGRLVHYTELPEAAWTWLPEYFGLKLSEAERDAMQAAGTFDAKVPDKPFKPDAAAKQRAATPLVREMAACYVAPWYAQLEAAHRVQPNGVSRRGPAIRQL